MKNIAVMAGGDSSEYEVSLKSAQNIIKALSSIEGYRIFLIECKGKSWFYEGEDKEFQIDKNDFSLTLNEEKINFDFVYIVIHGTPGENGKLQGYLDMMNIPYSTGGVLNTSMGFNKNMSKLILQSYGILSPKGVCIQKGDSYKENEIISELGLPLFVKPNEGGSSFGITKVKKSEDLSNAIEKAWLECEYVLIEEAVEGREFTCGLFEQEGVITVLPITEIKTNQEFFDYDAKYLGNSQEITPADIQPELKILIENTSRIIYKKLQCRGIVRIDYIYSIGKLYFLEINLTPGMTGASLVPQQIEVCGLSLPEILKKEIEGHF